MREELFFVRAVAEMVQEELHKLLIESKWGGGTIIKPDNVNATIRIRDTLRFTSKDWVERQRLEGWHEIRFHHTTQDNKDRIFPVYEYYRAGENGKWKQSTDNVAFVNVDDFAHPKTHMLFVAFCVMVAEDKHHRWEDLPLTESARGLLNATKYSRKALAKSSIDNILQDRSERVLLKRIYG